MFSFVIPTLFVQISDCVIVVININLPCFITIVIIIYFMFFFTKPLLDIYLVSMLGRHSTCNISVLLLHGHENRSTLETWAFQEGFKFSFSSFSPRWRACSPEDLPSSSGPAHTGPSARTKCHPSTTPNTFTLQPWGPVSVVHPSSCEFLQSMAVSFPFLYGVLSTLGPKASVQVWLPSYKNRW